MSREMNINQGKCIVNGFLVSGWSDDSDCLMFPDAVEMAVVKKGADGKKISTRTGERGGSVTIKVLANSPFAAFMSRNIKNIDANQDVNFDLSWANPSVGEYIRCTGGTLITAPKGSVYGKGEVANKIYVIDFESIEETPETSLLNSVLQGVNK